MNRACVWVAGSLPEARQRRAYRLAAALGLSLLAHMLGLAAPWVAWVAGRRAAAPVRLSVRLQAALPVAKAPPPPPRQAPPKAQRSRRSAPFHSSPVQAERPLSAVRDDVPPPVPDAPPNLLQGQELADRAYAATGQILRDMRRQESRLDPARGTLPASPRPVSRDVVARALEKQFGRPTPFFEESREPQPDGGMLYRFRTEQGAVCFRGLPITVNVAPGPQHPILVPMRCD